MELSRGDIVIVALRGPHTDKPHPALIVQSNLFNEWHGSLTLCPITSEFLDASLFRIAVAPGKSTGLKNPSQIMIDKLISVPRGQVAERIGRLDQATLDSVGGALTRWLDL